jgi:hypothetical protein
MARMDLTKGILILGKNGLVAPEEQAMVAALTAGAWRRGSPMRRESSNPIFEGARELSRRLPSGPDKRPAEIGEGTHILMLEKNRMQLRGSPAIPRNTSNADGTTQITTARSLLSNALFIDFTKTNEDAGIWGEPQYLSDIQKHVPRRRCRIRSLPDRANSVGQEKRHV